jgi:hypothetical protein
MQINVNINPDSLAVKEFADFVLLEIQDREQNTEISLALNVNHIKELHEALNILYGIRLKENQVID